MFFDCENKNDLWHIITYLEVLLFKDIQIFGLFSRKSANCIQTYLYTLIE